MKLNFQNQVMWNDKKTRAVGQILRYMLYSLFTYVQQSFFMKTFLRFI